MQSPLKTTIHIQLLLLIPLLLQSCFTGVESTPKITYREVKDSKADGTSEEDVFASRFKAEKYADWKPGKAFYVTSDKINLILSSDKADAQPEMPEEGDLLIFQGTRQVKDLTGKNIVEFIFTDGSDKASAFTYRTGITEEELISKQNIEIPFTIDMNLVQLVRDAISGHELYILTPLWLDAAGNYTEGKKYVKIRVENVIPATDIYPFRIIFTEADGKGDKHSVLMSGVTGNKRWAPREFPAIFSFTDPHLEYPQISDAMWDKIIHNRVAEGMTKTEASLAIGTPVSIDRGHDHSSAYERWRYSDGIYLIFEDGLLTKSNK